MKGANPVSDSPKVPIAEDLQKRYDNLIHRRNSCLKRGNLMQRAEFWMDYEDREVTLIERTSRAEAALEDLQELKRWIATLFDQVTYSDSYGVEGSSFSVCRWCGGGSGPGGTAPFRHNDGCMFENDALEKKVADVWQEVPELEAALEALQWTPITPENLPKRGDEVLRQRNGGLLSIVVGNAISPEDTTYQEWIDLKYTHFRPINPPRSEDAARSQTEGK
jgi:hypothetical protein